MTWGNPDNHGENPAPADTPTVAAAAPSDGASAAPTAAAAPATAAAAPAGAPLPPGWPQPGAQPVYPYPYGYGYPGVDPAATATAPGGFPGYPYPPNPYGQPGYPADPAAAAAAAAAYAQNPYAAPPGTYPPGAYPFPAQAQPGQPFQPGQPLQPGQSAQPGSFPQPGQFAQPGQPGYPASFAPPGFPGRPGGPAPSAADGKRKRRLIYGVVGVVVLAAIGGGIYAATGSSGSKVPSGSQLLNALVPVGDFQGTVAAISGGPVDSSKTAEPSSPYFAANAPCSIMIGAFGLEGFGEQSFAGNVYASGDGSLSYTQAVYAFSSASAAQSFYTSSARVLAACTSGTSNTYQNGSGKATGQMSYNVTDVTRPSGLGSQALLFDLDVQLSNGTEDSVQSWVLDGSYIYNVSVDTVGGASAPATPTVPELTQQLISSVGKIG